MTTAVKLEELQHVELFAELKEEDWECEIEGEMVEYQEGEVLFREGDPACCFYVFLEGTVQLHRTVRDQQVFIQNFYEKTTGGEVPILSGTPHQGTAVALTYVRVFELSEKNFWMMMGECETVRKKILTNMAERNRTLQAISCQREKLISLGTLSAGLAHELNNPAAAAHRAAQNLVKNLQEFDAHSSEMLRQVMFKVTTLPGFSTEEPFQPIYSVMNLEGIKLDPMEQSEREDELMDWMEKQGVKEAWNLAPTLVSVGFTRDNLAEFSSTLMDHYVSPFLKWLQKDVEMRLLAQDLRLTTERMSTLLAAIKAYSYIDQGVQWELTHLHEGLDNTLVILQHKLRTKHMEVVKQYDPLLPSVMAYGSELNQVWTNLLDNAIDAVADGGKITIKTYPDPEVKGRVLVEIIDNGTGIPPEIQDKIFEPFFTTKGIGKGTGIGLEITHRIVVSQHHGSIELTSWPGYTSFRVCLPIGM